MAKKSRYAELGEQTQAFMDNVEKFIKKKYGKIEPHWIGQLDLLATNYDLFMSAKEEIKKNGLLVTDRFGSPQKNPMLRVIVDCNIQCLKLVNQFGLSPSALGKIKDVEADDTDIIKGLLDG